MWQWMLSFKTAQATRHYQTIQICHRTHNRLCGKSLRKVVMTVRQAQQAQQVVKVSKVLLERWVQLGEQVILEQLECKAHKVMTGQLERLER